MIPLYQAMSYALCTQAGDRLQASSRKAVAISGPIVSIAPPCFGQTGLECEAASRRSSVNSPAALIG
jgi:hypothetical protein